MLAELGQPHGEPEHGERDDLRQAGERGVEPLDLPLVGGGLVAEDDAGHQDREEPGPLGDGGDAEDHEHAGQHPGRVEPLAWQRHPAHEREQRQPARHPDGHPDGHLQRELGHHVPGDGAGAAVRRQQRGEQRDPDRVVGARLALEQHPGPAGDLPPAEHGEHHGRVGGRHRRPHEQRQVPAHARDVVRGHRGARGGDERSGDPGPDDGGGGGAEPAPADVHAAVEQDDRQRHGDDVLDRGGGQHRARGRHDPCGHSCAAITAATRKNAGAGTRSRALSRLESTAAVPARPITATMSPNWLVPDIDGILRGTSRRLRTGRS